MNYDLSTAYGLPKKVKFCKKCVMSNQRPASAVEFKHRITTKKQTLKIDKNNICDACKMAKRKEAINWQKREKELIKLLDKYRRNDGYYDCIVPGSGGKDSMLASHILKNKYGMHPLTVTWPPILYTDYGYRNFISWIEKGGCDNISFNRNGEILRLLTRLAVINLLHPFQTFILGQKNIPPKIALNLKIPLIFYGENEAEYGNPIADNSTSLRNQAFYAMKNPNEVFISGVSLKELKDCYKLSLIDLYPYLPASYKEFEKFNIEVRYLGYYLKWIPQEAYYYASENVGFRARPYRTEGTYSKYNSIDDKIDDLHYYTTFIKFGIGRATYDASQEIRNHYITREEGVALVKKYDGEFPNRYFKEVMNFLDLTPDLFHKICDKFRSPHLWKKEKSVWKLRHTVFRGGTDD
ncbi:MAG: N-acetyl sugar amidotransferase [Actinobacteria bacterium]|nr:N-acetyl sugar amidotransferase [Actinomycetota bacterium]